MEQPSRPCSRDADDPEELTGARVHTTAAGWTPALALDAFIILCLSNKFIFHEALTRPIFNLACSAENNLQKTGGSLPSHEPKNR